MILVTPRGHISRTSKVLRLRDRPYTKGDRSHLVLSVPPSQQPIDEAADEARGGEDRHVLAGRKHGKLVASRRGEHGDRRPSPRRRQARNTSRSGCAALRPRLRRSRAGTMVSAGATVPANSTMPNTDAAPVAEHGIVGRHGAKLVADPQRAEREQKRQAPTTDGKDEDGRRPQDAKDGAGDQVSPRATGSRGSQTPAL